MTTSEKGEIAVAKVIIKCMELGYTPSRPIKEQSRYDLIIDTGEKLLRAQVKYCDCKLDDSYIVTLTRKTNSRHTKKRIYNISEIDILLVYIKELDCICWITDNFWNNKTTIRLRNTPVANNQPDRSHFVKDFKI